jgi:YbbR domain-containing protein
MFWFLIKLSDVYTVDYSFKVNYKSIPDSMKLTKAVDSTLDLSLTARGFTILKLNLFDNMDRLDINLINYKIDHESGSRYSIYTGEIKRKFSELIGVDEQDISFSTERLYFDLEKMKSKKVKVVPKYTLEFIDQYGLYDEVEVKPEYITVFGPGSTLKDIEQIQTKQLVMKDINAMTEVMVDLDNPAPNIVNLDPGMVQLKFDVEKYTEAEFEIVVDVSKLKYKIKTFPTKVKVFFKVAQKDFSNIKENQFTIVPIEENIDLSIAKKLHLKAVKYPDVVKNIRIVPSEVEFLIIK